MGQSTIEEIGRVERFYGHASVAAGRLRGSLRVGETVYVRGWTTDFRQQIDSLQINHESVEEAGAGELVGVRVDRQCRPRDIVYKLRLAA